MNKFDMNPYRERITYDENKIMEMFSIAENMDINELLVFSTKNKIPLSLLTKSGDSLIHVIVKIDENIVTEKSKLNMCRYLISHDVSYDSPNKDNISPLHIACQLQLQSIIELLLKNNADINRQDNIGNTPMHYLLSGIIRNYEIKEVENIIPPKKKNNNLDKIYLEIKQSMKDYLQNNVKNLPILETLQQTFENILEYDKNIEESITDILSKQTAILSSIPAASEVNLIYKFIADNIKRKIIDTVQIKPLEDIQIITNPTSEDLKYENIGIIKNGDNVKREIKNEIKKNIDLIQNLSVNEEELKSLSDVDDINENTSNNNFENFQILYDGYKHPNAYDNASPIIDFKKIIFMGGARNLEINKTINTGSQLNTTGNKNKINLLNALNINDTITINDNFKIRRIDGVIHNLDTHYTTYIIPFLQANYNVTSGTRLNRYNNIPLMFDASKYNINLFSHFENDIYKMYILLNENGDKADLLDFIDHEQYIINDFMIAFNYMTYNFINNYDKFITERINLLEFYKKRHENYKTNLIEILNIIKNIYNYLNKFYEIKNIKNGDNYINFLSNNNVKKKNLNDLIIKFNKIIFTDCNEYQLTNIIITNLQNIFKYLLNDDGIVYLPFMYKDNPINIFLKNIYVIFNTDLRYFNNYITPNENKYSFFNLFMKNYMFLFRLNYDTLMIKILTMYNDTKQAEWLLTAFSMVNCLNSHNNLEGKINDTTLILIGALGTFDTYIFKDSTDRFQQILDRYTHIYDLIKITYTDTVFNDAQIDILLAKPYYKSLLMNFIYHLKNNNENIKEKIYNIETSKEYPASSEKIYNIESNDIWQVKKYDFTNSFKLKVDKLKAFVKEKELFNYYLQNNVSTYLDNTIYYNDEDFIKYNFRRDYIILILETLKQSRNIPNNFDYKQVYDIIKQIYIILLYTNAQHTFNDLNIFVIEILKKLCIIANMFLQTGALHIKINEISIKKIYKEFIKFLSLIDIINNELYIFCSNLLKIVTFRLYESTHGLVIIVKNKINSIYNNLKEDTTNIYHEEFMYKKIKNNYEMALYLGLHYQGTLHYQSIPNATKITNYLYGSIEHNPFNFWSIRQNKHIMDKVYFYNTYENNYIIPTEKSYDYTLEKLSNEVNKDINNYLIPIKRIISSILTNTKQLGEIFTNYYMEILYNCKIIESNNTYIKNKIDVFDYQKLANYLNLINANYFIYYYIFDKSKIIKLSRFNYYQLPIFEKTKPIEFQNIYYMPEESDMIIKENDDTHPNSSAVPPAPAPPAPAPPTPAPAPPTPAIIYNYGLINELFNNYENNKKNINIKIFNTDKTDFKYNKTDKLPQSLYNHINLFFKYSMKQLFKDLLRCLKLTPPVAAPALTGPPATGPPATGAPAVTGTPVPPVTGSAATGAPVLVENCSILVNFVEQIEKKLDYQIPTSQLRPIAYNILFKVIESYFIDVCMAYINYAILIRVNKSMNSKDTLSLSVPVPVPLSNFNDIILSSFNMKKIDFSHIKTKNDLEYDKDYIKNLENLIIHCNFSNLNMIKNKYTIYINEKIIDNILASNINLSLKNINDNTCIYSLLEYYTNDKLIENIFKKYNFNKMEDNKPLNFINKELKNLKFKLYGDIDYEELKLENIFDNIHDELYQNIINYILSNNLFGNNILKNIKSSFDTLTYNILKKIDDINITGPSPLYNRTNFFSVYFIDIFDNKYCKYNGEEIYTYFTSSFYLKNNNILKDIYAILKNTIIEIFSKNIITTIEESIKHIFKENIDIILNYILKNTDKSQKSIEEIINEIPESLIRTVLKIYKSKYDKDTSVDTSVKDILNNIFDQLYYYQDIIGKELIDNMKLYYVNYYETLIIKILPLLLVNCENILKFFIVLNRLNKIKTTLENYK
jgi:hypothetical protein